MHWIYLLVAIVFEVLGTLSIKQITITNNYYWVISVAVFYTLAFSLIAMAVKKIDIGTAYAIWAGVGTALIAVLGWLIFKESMNLIKIIAISFIVIGSIMLKLQY